MTFIEACVANPIKVSVGALLLILFGVIALLRMPMQLTPEVQIPTLTVETLWPGASPQEVEREITQEQEDQLKSVEGLTKLSSTSADSRSTIILEFNIGTNMEEALLKVNSRLQQVRDYPEDAKQPVISTSNSSNSPIAWFILSARQSTAAEIRQFADQLATAGDNELAERLEAIARLENPGLRLLRLQRLADDQPDVIPLLPPQLNVAGMRRFAEDTIKARFERVRGVSTANVLGGLVEEMQVIVDPERLAARQLTIDDIRRVLRQQNRDTSGGDFWEGKRRYVVRTINQFRSAEQIGDQILATIDGTPVYIRDVADVRMGFKKPDGIVRRFGDNVIAVNALRETGANVLDVMSGLRTAVQELNDQALFDRDLQLLQVYDETEYIYAAVGLVNQNIVIGSALTMIVLMMFLHMQFRTLVTVPLIVVTTALAVFVSPWYFLLTLAVILIAGFWFARGAIVVSLAIPISVIGTFLMMNLWDRSLNVISLAGMAFAVGMLVDNAVVVLENIYRHFQDGKTPRQAAVEGGQEVWGAVLASTLTTLAVFLPVLFVQEEAGQLFRDIALAISAAVGLSLLVSITMIPTATARLLGGGNQAMSQVRYRLDVGRDNWLIRWIVGINRLIQSRLAMRLMVVISLAAGAVGITYLTWPKVEYLPSGNRNLVFGILLPPAGFNLDELTKIGEIVEAHLEPFWDVDPNDASTKDLEFPAIFDFFFVARGRQVFLGVRAVDSTRAIELVPLIQQVREKLEGGTIVVAKQSSLFEQGLTGGRTIDVEITGPDLGVLVQIGGQVLGQTVQLLPTGQARPVPSLDLSSPEYHLIPRLLENEPLGVDATSLGYMIDALVDGAYATDYFFGGEKIDLTIIGSPATVRRSQDVDFLPVATPTGRLVPISTLAEPVFSSGPEQIDHRERQRAITIEVSPPADVSLEDALQLIETQIVTPIRQSGQLDGGYQIMLSGTADKLRDTWRALRGNVLLALLITYLLMAALFESWLYPLVIILSVPLGAVGGVMGLRLLGVYLELQGIPAQSLDVLTMLGFVILIGTVVNNAILIVHQSLNLMRRDELTTEAAILESVRTRVRPIAMTTATTVLGLCPLVLFPGAGSELYRGLGSVLLGGLLVSTLFTLFVVPALFRLMMDSKAGLVGWLWKSPLAKTTVSGNT